MSGKLAVELKQSRPFESPAHEAFLNVIKTASLLSQAETELLKPFELSPAQYNVLRILRGAGEAGRSCQEIGERLVARDPDVTRLTDRLDARRLVARARSAEDRRVVITRITRAGLDLLAKIDPLDRDMPAKTLGRLGRKKLEALIDLLEETRETL
jgi:DNA-binding MarR family transcriptional regulator